MSFNSNNFKKFAASYYENVEDTAALENDLGNVARTFGTQGITGVNKQWYDYAQILNDPEALKLMTEEEKQQLLAEVNKATGGQAKTLEEAAKLNQDALEGDFWTSIRNDKEKRAGLLKSYRDKANALMAQGKQNEAYAYFVTADQIEKNIDNPNFTSAHLAANVKEITNREAYDRKQQLMTSDAAKKYMSWQSAQNFNSQFSKLGFVDKLKWYWGAIMQKLGFQPNKDSFYSKFNNQYRQTSAAELQKQYSQEFSKAAMNGLIKSKKFVDAQGNPIPYEKLTPEQQAEVNRDYASYAKQNAAQIQESMIANGQFDRGSLGMVGRGVYDETSKAFDEQAKGAKSPYVSKMDPKYQWGAKNNQNNNQQTPPPQNPPTANQQPTKPATPPSASTPSNPATTPTTQKPATPSVETPKPRVSAKEAADEFQV